MATPRAPPVGDVTNLTLQGILRRVASPDLPRWRRVLEVAWPVSVANLLQSLALTVDLVLVGRLGAGALATAGVATQVLMLAMALATGFGVGATALVARAIGAGDVRGAGRASAVAVAVALLASLPITLALVLGAAPLLDALGAEDVVLPEAERFLRILAFGIPGNFVILAATGALHGAGDTRPPLLIGVLVNVVNLVLDWLLIFGNLGAPELGLAGAAVATTVSYAVGGVLFLALLRWGRRPIVLAGAPVREARELARRVTRVGAPAALESLLLGLGFTLYLVLILDFGTAALAAHQIGLRVQSFAFMPGFGFSAAASALVGQGLGRGDAEDAESSGWAALSMSLLVMLGLSAALFILAEPLADLFVDDVAALALGVTWIHVLVLAMPAIAFHFTASGALRGAGDTRWPLAVSFLGLYGLRLPLAYVLGVRLGFGMLGVWAAYVIEYYARAVVVTVRFARGRWKSLRV